MRFRVALSFPGEHRARVEKIAETLVDELSRERVLYDKWHTAEFNQPDLDVYLPNLYQNESELIAAFVCKEYNAKEWCGLEWRACRELRKQREGKRVMIFRLDDDPVPGLLSIDGYQDIRNMTDAEVAADILKRITPAAAPLTTTVRTFTRKLPTVDPHVFGREAELALLEKA